MKIDPSVDSRLKKVKFFIEADSFSEFQLWKEHSNEENVNWKQSFGFIINIQNFYTIITYNKNESYITNI